jgi:hypothetical protein
VNSRVSSTTTVPIRQNTKMSNGEMIGRPSTTNGIVEKGASAGRYSLL